MENEVFVGDHIRIKGIKGKMELLEEIKDRDVLEITKSHTEYNLLCKEEYIPIA